MKNLINGEGFYTNENVFNHMIDNGVNKQDILDYFGFKGKYDPTNPLFKKSNGAAITDVKTGEIYFWS